RDQPETEIQRRAAADRFVQRLLITRRYVLGEVAHRRHRNAEHQKSQITGDGIDQIPGAVAVVAEFVEREGREEVYREDGDDRNDPIAADALEQQSPHEAAARAARMLRRLHREWQKQLGRLADGHELERRHRDEPLEISFDRRVEPLDVGWCRREWAEAGLQT